MFEFLAEKCNLWCKIQVSTPVNPGIMEKIRLSQDQWDYLFKAKDKNIFSNITDDAAFAENIHFTGKFVYSDSLAISFKNCVFEEKVSFYGCTFSSDVFLTTCEFKSDLYFGELVSEHKITFLDCIMEGQTVFGDNSILRLELNCKSVNKLIFSDQSNIRSIQIGGKDRNKYGGIHLTIGQNLERFEINHTEIEDLYIGYSTLEGELLVANSCLKKMTLDNFRNAGSLKFLNCQSGKFDDCSILVNQSNLGKAEFFKFGFSRFSEINFTNSVLFECIFINCSWAKGNMISKLVHFSSTLDNAEDATERALAENRKDVFKQIKAAFAKQGDYVLEQYFHGLEMNAYYSSLSFKTDFWTKVILRLSFWTSDYGQSFIRPLLWIIGANTFLFSGLYVLHATEYNSYDFRQISNYINTAASVLNLMNPLHKMGDNTGGIPFILDTISRIVSSYLIYNLIRSTRRFVK